MAEADLKLPKRVISVINRVRQGETLCLHLHHEQTGECKRVFHYEPSGKRAPPPIGRRGGSLRSAPPRQRWAVRRRHVTNVDGLR